MKAYDYVEKFLNDCEGSQKEFSMRLKNSLVRLTKRYDAIEQEQLITKIIKGDIFSYVFVPEIPRENAITINEPIECGLGLHPQVPTIDDLPKATNVGYILVKNNSTLYFINKLNKNDNIKSFPLNEHQFNRLVFEFKINNSTQVIPLLSKIQQDLITKLTGHIPIISRLSSKYPQEWLALTQSQANTIIQNPREKIAISLGERYGAADIDCLWVVEEEADSHLKTGPSRTTNIIFNPPLDTTNVKRKNKPVKHPEFELFIRAIKKQGYSTFMRNLEDCGCQFEKEIDYIKHVQSSLIVKEKSKYKTDSTSEYVKDVAIIRKATYKNESEKEVVVYRLAEEISNVESSSKIKEHRKVPFRTIQDYFSG